MLNLWIVDDDVSSAYRLKQSLIAEAKKQLPSSDCRVTVFHDGGSFLAALDEAKKINTKSPSLIFFEVQLGGGRGLDMLGDLVGRGQVPSGLVTVVSTIGFGRYERYFQSLKLEVPPFIQKTQIDSKLAGVLENLVRLQKNGGGSSIPVPRIPRPLVRQAVLALEDLIKIVRDDYYEKGPSVLTEGQYLDDLTEIFEIADDLALDNLADCADKLLLGPEKKKGASSMRTRKDLKDFFEAGEKALELLKGMR